MSKDTVNENINCQVVPKITRVPGNEVSFAYPLCTKEFGFEALNKHRKKAPAVRTAQAQDPLSPRAPRAKQKLIGSPRASTLSVRKEQDNWTSRSISFRDIDGSAGAVYRKNRAQLGKIEKFLAQTESAHSRLPNRFELQELESVLEASKAHRVAGGEDAGASAPEPPLMSLTPRSRLEPLREARPVAAMDQEHESKTPRSTLHEPDSPRFPKASSRKERAQSHEQVADLKTGLDAWPAGMNDKPGLLLEMEDFLRSEQLRQGYPSNCGLAALSTCKGQSSQEVVYNENRLNAVRQVFDQLCHRFRIYGELFSSIKAEYELAIRHFAAEAEAVPQLKSELYEMEETCERRIREAEVFQQKDKDDLAKRLAQRTETIKQLRNNNEMLTKRMLEQSDQDQREIKRLRDLLAEKDNLLDQMGGMNGLKFVQDLERKVSDMEAEMLKLTMQRNRAVGEANDAVERLRTCIPLSQVEDTHKEIRKLKAENLAAQSVHRLDGRTYNTLIRLAQSFSVKMEDIDLKPSTQTKFLQLIEAGSGAALARLQRFVPLMGKLSGVFTLEELLEHLTHHDNALLKILDALNCPKEETLLAKDLMAEVSSLHTLARLLVDGDAYREAINVANGQLECLGNVDGFDPSEDQLAKRGVFTDCLSSVNDADLQKMIFGLQQSSSRAVEKELEDHYALPSQTISLIKRQLQVGTSVSTIMHRLRNADAPEIELKSAGEMMSMLKGAMSNVKAFKLHVASTGKVNADHRELQWTELINNFETMMSTLQGQVDALNAELRVYKPMPKTPKDGKGGNFMEGLGTGASVPRYLRVKGKVKCRPISKAVTEQMVKDVWRSKAADPKGKNMNMEEYFHLFLKEKFGDKGDSVVIEWAYNMQDALKRFSFDADCELFLKILQGELNEEVYLSQMQMITDFGELCKANDPGGSKVLKIGALMDLMHSFFENKSEERFEDLRVALEKDLMDTVDKEQVNYTTLFSEDSEGNQGNFAEEVRDQFLSERIEFLQHLDEKFTELGGEKEELTVDETIQGIKLADPYIPESVIQQYVMKGFGCRTADDLSTFVEMQSKLAIAKIMKRIRKGAFMPSKKSAAK